MVEESKTLEVFRLLVEEARDARRARRELSNVFMTLNLGGVGALGFLSSDAEHHFKAVLLAWLIVALILTCVIWNTSNVYYKRILKAKYEIIHDYEARLGENPIETEWKKLGGAKALRLFTLERAMPTLFIAGYIAFVIIQTDLWAPISGAMASAANWALHGFQ